MKKIELNDFAKYVKEEYNCDIEIKKNNKPDTFDNIFNGSFVNDSTYHGKEGINMDLSERTKIKQNIVKENGCKTAVYKPVKTIYQGEYSKCQIDNNIKGKRRSSC